MQPSYKQHTAIDDKAGVVVDVETTTGEASEASVLVRQIERVEAKTGRTPKTVSADAGYAYSWNYAALEVRGIDAVIPAKPEVSRRRHIPARRFKYDERHEIVRCPAGKKLTARTRTKHGWDYRTTTADCRDCPLKARCIGETGRIRKILIVDGYTSLQRARRRDWDEQTREIYNRHRCRSEGANAEAKLRHGLARAVRRGLGNMAIQSYLTSAVMNLKRLAAHIYGIFGRVKARNRSEKPNTFVPIAIRLIWIEAEQKRQPFKVAA
jgi:IS5 family transposase